MGKALGTILEIAGVAALAVTGIGAIAGLAAFGTLAGVGIGSVGLGTIAAAGAASLALGQTLLQKTPKPATTSQALKTAIPPRVSGYGRNRLHWAYALFDTAPNGWAVDVGAFHDGRIDGVEVNYIGDQYVNVVGNVVQEGHGGEWGSSDGTVQVGYSLGRRQETAFSAVIGMMGGLWTSQHRGDGVACGYMLSKNVKAENFQKIFPYGGPNQQPYSIGARLQRVYDWRDPAQSLTDDSTWKWSENAILHLAHYILIRMETSEPRFTATPTVAQYNAAWAAYWTQVQAVWNLKFAPTLSYWTAAANDAGTNMLRLNNQTIMIADNSPDADHTMLVLDPTGLAVGMSVTLTASDGSASQVSTITSVSGNVVGISPELASGTFYPAGSGVSWTSTSAHPVYEPRYRSCVVHRHTDAHKDILKHLLDCCDGWLAPRSDGAYIVYSGRYTAPTVAIGPDEIVSYSMQERVADEEAINCIKLTYVSACHLFNAVETDDWTDEEDIDDRGQILSDTLENQVPSHSQARRLAKRKIAQVMAQRRGTVTTTAAGRKMIGQRYIRLQIIEAGTTFLDAPVEVTKVTRNLQTGGVTFEWTLADPNVDAWNPATEEGLPAPIGTRVALQPVDAPVITAAVPDYSAVSDDGTGTRIDLTVSGPNRDDLTWFARWRVQGASVWNEDRYSDIDPSASVTLVTSFVPTAQTVEVQAAYQTGDGRLSDYSPSVLVNTATDQTPPDAATSITVTSWSDSLNLTTNTISRASSYRWRFYASDGTTLLRTISTADRSVSYTAAQALTDGVSRSYIVKVAGVNAAGVGAEAATSVITNAAPSTVTGVSASGGAGSGTISFTNLNEPDVAGYVVYISNTSGFDPLTQGTGYNFNGSPAYIGNLAAGTFYAKVAAYDAWTQRPDLLNFAAQVSFTATAGSGGSTGGGGGYCVTVDTPILLDDMSEKPAGELVVGDRVWTQHEETMEWGSFPVEAIEIVDSDDVWSAQIGPAGLKATGEHRVWLSGWVHMKDLGVKASAAKVAKITVTDAHTYISAGVLSHNVKPALP